MAGYQQLTLVGNVGADPTVTDTQWGPVTNFDVAVNGRNNPPIWYSVSAWGKLGEAMAQYLTKGREVLIESDHFEPVWWTNRRGEIETRLNVKANRVVFLDGGSPEHKNQPQQGNYQRKPTQQAPQQQRSQQQRKPQNDEWDDVLDEQTAQEVPF